MRDPASDRGRCRGHPFEEEYFGRTYRDYEAQNPPSKLAFYRRVAEEAVGATVRPRVLDVGCGPGLFLEALGPAWERFGTDVSRWAVAEARRRVPAASIECSSAEFAPFEGPFDLITAFDVLEHLPDPEGAISVLRKRLCPGGALLAVLPVYDGPAGVLVRLLDRDPTHLQKRGRGFWLGLLGRDLRVEDWTGIFRYLLPGRRYMHFATHGLRGVAPAILVRARNIG